VTPGSAVKARLLPVGSCLAESHLFVCVLIDEAQFTYSLWINKQHENKRSIAPIGIVVHLFLEMVAMTALLSPWHS
jgi:hypothetical protein